MIDRKPAEALARYNEAYEATGDPAILYNRGRAYEAMGDYPAALDQLEAFDRVAPPELRARVSGLPKFLAELRLRVTTVNIRTDPAGASVRLRDRTLGVTPLAPMRFNAGNAVLEVSKDSYFPIHRELTLVGGESLDVTLSLSARATSGVLTVTSAVSGALVTVDQTSKGAAPFELSLKAGSHAVRVERDGYEPASTSVVLLAGESKRVDVPLKESFALTNQWWFWTGLGVIVVGGAVITYAALTTEKDPGKGDFGPGRTTLPVSGVQF
jgi:hypothetical protein